MSDKTVQNVFITEMRKNFESYGGRENLMSLMIEAIRLDLMKKNKRDISFSEASEQFMDEASNLVGAITNAERRQMEKNIVKMFGINP